ncbi:hypothetical protein [Streptomyces viridosporus]|uniref:Uncharacterized protein n=1 Tax=Streptomyces viridosporus T7A TaxID=665577 RepID=A0ABX6AAH0_STRVD|nr:hypothetical protein [Streptomyces viridosporus]QEU83728.1 hypothetical protein CP969_02660 [Streptomyces viridosporus T7A]
MPDRAGSNTAACDRKQDDPVPLDRRVTHLAGPRPVGYRLPRVPETAAPGGITALRRGLQFPERERHVAASGDRRQAGAGTRVDGAARPRRSPVS